MSLLLSLSIKDSTMNATTLAILRAAQVNHGMFEDDHSHATARKLEVIVEYQTQGRNGPRVFTCPIIPGSICSLNYLYVDKEDGKAHLSTFSVGPTFDLRGLTKGDCHMPAIQQAVEQFNEEFKNSPLDFQRDNKIIGVYTLKDLAQAEATTA